MHYWHHLEVNENFRPHLLLLSAPLVCRPQRWAMEIPLVGCSHAGFCGMGALSKLSNMHDNKLGRSLMSFLFQDFVVCFPWMFSLPVSILCTLLRLFAWAGPSSHPHLDFCGGMIWMYFLYWWSLWRFPSVKGEVLIFRQRVETEVAIRSVQFCVFTCLLTPRLKKPALPPHSHV